MSSGKFRNLARGQALGVLVLLVLGSVTIFYVKGETTPSYEGLPVDFKLVSDQTETVVVNGTSEVHRTVWGRSEPLLAVDCDASWLLNDPAHLGDLGKYGLGESRRVYFNLPADYGITIFPGLVTSGSLPLPQPWADRLKSYQATHPDVRLVSQGERLVMKEGNAWQPAAELQRIAVPIQGCDLTREVHPYAIEYWIVLAGDTSQLVAPTTESAYVYRKHH